MSVGVSCNFMDNVVQINHNKGKCCAIVLCRQMLCLWQMLMPFDSVTTEVDVLTSLLSKVGLHSINQLQLGIAEIRLWMRDINIQIEWR